MSAQDDDAAVVELLTRTLLAEAASGGLSNHDLWGRQFDLGLAWVDFPRGLGGLGVDRSLQSIVNRRMEEANVPSSFYDNLIGIGIAGPTIAAHGDQLQMERWLRRMFRAEEIWCQLFSEPGAGSDLASVSTRAEPDGTDWIVNGQKVWTSFAHRSRWGTLLARTDPSLPKHKGLTYFVVDMTASGVDIRPLRQMTGDAEFNEVYFTDVRIPDENRLGEIGEGWQVALTTLMNERTSLGGAGGPNVDENLADPAMQLFRDGALPEESCQWDDLLDLWLRGDALRALCARGAVLAERGTPGPENSISKLVAAELRQDVSEWMMDYLESDGLPYAGYQGAERRLGDYADPGYAFLRSRATTIEGGTTDIMLNILAERVLGLPGETRADKNVPWSDVPRN